MMSAKQFEAKQLLFAFLNRGEKISFANDNVVIKTAEGKIKHKSTCYRLFALFVVGHITITSGILQRAHKFNFPIVLMNSSLRVYEVIGWKMAGNVLLRRRQYEYEGAGLAKHIIENKLLNQRFALNTQRQKSIEVKSAIALLDDYLGELRQNDYELPSILGIEGTAARVYFKNHFNNIEWNGRKPRIKADFVNSTLDIGYTILFNLISALLGLYGFDEYCGVLHREFYMRKSLACDLVEPFRPLIDLQVKKAINLRQCKADDFTLINQRFVLKWEKNAEYVQFLTKPFLEEKQEIFLYVQSWYRAFMKGKTPAEFPIFEMR